jgi:hypothetical protein
MVREDLLLANLIIVGGQKNAIDVHDEKVLRQGCYLRLLRRKGSAEGWLSLSFRDNRIGIVQVTGHLGSSYWTVLTVL